MFHRLLAAGVVMAAAGSCMAGTAISINEIRIDQTSTDDSEYFELTGPAGASLANMWYIVIGDGTGASGVIESVTDLSAYSIPASGFFLGAESTFGTGSLSFTAVPDAVFGATGLNFENSDNVTHMLVSGFTGANGNDLDTNDDGVLDVTPWGSILDSIALITPVLPPTTNSEWPYGATVGPDGTFVPGHVYRYPDASGPWAIGAFAGGSDTPGATNVPGPGAAALVAMGGLLAARRRRS